MTTNQTQELLPKKKRKGGGWMIVGLILLIAIGGGIGYYMGKKPEAPETQPLALLEEEQTDPQEDPEMEYEEERFISWDDFSWEGPDAEDSYIDSIIQRRVIQPYKNSTVKYWDLYSLIWMAGPLFVMDKQDIPDEEATEKLFLNDMATFSGRQNDRLLALYARLRNHIFRLVSGEQFEAMNISYLIGLLNDSYQFYGGEEGVDEELLQYIYDGLCSEEYADDGICGKLEKIATELDIVFPYLVEDGDTWNVERAWAYSFWARRYGEDNLKAARTILNDLESVYIYQGEGFNYFNEHVLNGDEREVNEIGDYLYRAYVDDKLYCKYYYNQQGERSGTWVHFDQQGGILKEYEWGKDQIHGEIRQYEEGRLHEKSYYRNDTLVLSEYYDEQGELECAYRYTHTPDKQIVIEERKGQGNILREKVNGRMHGAFIEYYPDGEMKTEAAFVDGHRHGDYKRYYPGGRLKEQINYVKGLGQGMKRVYDEEGNLKSEVNYVDGYPDGIYQEYYPSGALKQQFSYVNRKVHGIVKCYYEDGTLEWTIPYEQGKKEGEAVKYKENGKEEKRVVYKDGEEVK